MRVGGAFPKEVAYAILAHRTKIVEVTQAHPVVAVADDLVDAFQATKAEVRRLSESLDDVAFLVPRTASLPDLSALPALRVVQVLSAGTEWIEGLVPQGVTLCNARGARDAPVAEWVVGAVLGAFSGLLRAAGERRWEHRPPREVAGARVVIVGYGSIGRAAAERLSSLGADVEGVGRSRLDDLPDLLAQADVVVNLLPLNKDTPGFFGPDRLALVPDGALFLNAGRGGTVDTDALLAQGRRFDVVLDVTDPEPLPDDHPLWTAPGVLAITAHQSGDSTAADARAVEFAVAQLRRFAAGEPLENVVVSG